MLVGTARTMPPDRSSLSISRTLAYLQRIIRGELLNVKVEVELIYSPKSKHKKQMYNAAESLTDDKHSIIISTQSNKMKIVVAEFTIKKARQIDVVDKIGREFSYCLTEYNTSSISFPVTKKKPRKRQPSSNRTTGKVTFTEKQGQYLAFINKFIKSNGYSPEVTDFAKHFCVGSTSIYRIIAKLQEKGFIKRIPQKSRSIELLISEDELPKLEGSVLGEKDYRFQLLNRFKG
jgi:hypothetical protein